MFPPTTELLYLRRNDLTGTIPTELGLLTKLKELQIASNQLTGELPTEFGLLMDVRKCAYDLACAGLVRHRHHHHHHSIHRLYSQ